MFRAMLSGLVLIALSHEVGGADALITADIQFITSDAETGVCAVWLVPRPASDATLADLTGCNQRWVSIDCNADFVSSKSLAKTNFDMAQAAMFLDRPVKTLVTDDWKINVGSTQYCTSTVMQLFN